MGSGQTQVREALQNFLLGDGAAAVSDETCLEQVKLKAQEALKNVLLGDDTAAASEEALLQRTKPKAQDASKNSLVMTGKRTPMMQFGAGQAQN